MSLPATLFAVYFSIGLLLMVVAVVAERSARRRQALDLIAGPDEISAAVLIFIAVLWPIWLVGLLLKHRGTDRGEE